MRRNKLSIADGLVIYLHEKNHLEFVGLNQTTGPAVVCLHIPKQFEKMKWMAKHLCVDNPFVRIGLYEINRKVYWMKLHSNLPTDLADFVQKNTTIYWEE